MKYLFLIIPFFLIFEQQQKPDTIIKVVFKYDTAYIDTIITYDTIRQDDSQKVIDRLDKILQGLK